MPAFVTNCVAAWDSQNYGTQPGNEWTYAAPVFHQSFVVTQLIPILCTKQPYFSKSQTPTGYGHPGRAGGLPVLIINFLACLVLTPFLGNFSLTFWNFL
jgi:hypothetical protein